MDKRSVEELQVAMTRVILRIRLGRAREADLSMSKMARGSTEETKRKASSAFNQLTPADITKIKEMNRFGKGEYITKRFGDKNEQFGVDFGLFPLWSGIVEELVMAT